MILVLLIALVVLSVAPQWWVRRTMARHRENRPDLPGTGGELAVHLLREYELEGVRVEGGAPAPHYDPESRTIRLDADTWNGRSLTAVAVAAHEFGHALQHANGEAGLRLRQFVVKLAAGAQVLVPILLIAAPLSGIVLRSPAAALAPLILGALVMGLRVLAHLVTLPVEYDASFGKALPILRDGGYLHGEDLDAARGVLKAAALTYVAQAAMGLLDIGRWLRGIRF